MRRRRRRRRNASRRPSRRRRRNAGARRRRRRRNAWYGDHAGHVRAGRKGYRLRKQRGGRKRKRPYRGLRNNPRRRRRRRRNHGRRRSYNRRRRRNYSGGAAPSFGSVTGSLTSGFRVPVLQKAAVITAGAIGNTAISAGLQKLDFVPDFLKTGIGSMAFRLGTAGLMGWGVGQVNRAWAAPMFLGGVIQVVMEAANQYIVPNIPGLSGLDEMNDYLNTTDVQRTRALGEFGDFLDTRNVREARALGQNVDEGDVYVAEELAAIA